MPDVKTITKKIMIVDDMLIVSMELQEKLKDAGYAIAGTAASGEAAVSLFRETDPDLILMDIMLKGEMNGIEAAAIINEMSDVPVIYTTAYSDEKTLNELKATGPYAYLLKPYDDRELFTAVELALDRHQHRREIQASEIKYRSLFEESSDAVCICDDQGGILNANSAFNRLFAVQDSDCKGFNTRDLFQRPEELDRIIEDFDSSYTVNNSEVFLKSGSGEELVCQVSIIRLSGGDSGGNGFQVIIHDITDFRRGIERQDTMIRGIIQAMALTVEARDPYTAGHQRRVAEIAVLIAEEMGFNKVNIGEIQMAAMIHDLGKIYVPAEILSKPGRITDTEFSIIKAHPAIGYDILKGIDFGFPLADIVRQHHERIDGTGYPSGLKGSDILMEARIIAAADVLEAMASHRPYRPALGLDVAVSEIQKNSDTHFDIDVVKAFMSVAGAGGFERIINA